MTEKFVLNRPFAAKTLHAMWVVNLHNGVKRTGGNRQMVPAPPCRIKYIYSFLYTIWGGGLLVTGTHMPCPQDPPPMVRLLHSALLDHSA